jgi:hypothetical protein
MKNIPCQNCITLSICKSEISNTKYPTLIPLLNKCALLRDFVNAYSTDLPSYDECLVGIINFLDLGRL